MLYKIFNADSHSQKYRYEVGVDNLKIVLTFLPFKELEEEKGGKKRRFDGCNCTYFFEERRRKMENKISKTYIMCAKNLMILA